MKIFLIYCEDTKYILGNERLQHILSCIYLFITIYWILFKYRNKYFREAYQHLLWKRNLYLLWLIKPLPFTFTNSNWRQSYKQLKMHIDLMLMWHHYSIMYTSTMYFEKDNWFQYTYSLIFFRLKFYVSYKNALTKWN